MRLPLIALILVALVCGIPSSLHGQTLTQAYTLENVWLLPDTSHPFAGPQQMTGRFEWTYTLGDFENGSAQFTSLYIPFSGTNLGPLNYSFDIGSIEMTLIGNWHDRGVDLTLRLLNDLAPGQTSTIDPVNSNFQIEQGTITAGHIISGTVVPAPPLDLSLGTCPSIQLNVDGATPGGTVAVAFALGEGTLVIPSGALCGTTTLGLDGTIALGLMLAANANGTASWSATIPQSLCGGFYLQALDFASCGVSQVVQL